MIDLEAEQATEPASPIVPTDVVVIGAGGHGRELADIVRAVSIVHAHTRLAGIADDGTPDRDLLRRTGVRHLGGVEATLDDDVRYAIGIGSPAIRHAIDGRLADRIVGPLVHPRAQLGSGCSLARGVVLAQGAIVTTNVSLGRHAHVNVGATVSHDCTIGRWVTICPGVTITGDVTLGDRVFVGAGATILPGCTIGPDVTIGAGAVVTSDVAAGRTVRGVPAR